MSGLPCKTHNVVLNCSQQQVHLSPNSYKYQYLHFTHPQLTPPPSPAPHPPPLQKKSMNAIYQRVFKLH